MALALARRALEQVSLESQRLDAECRSAACEVLECVGEAGEDLRLLGNDPEASAVAMRLAAEAVFG